MKKKIKPVQNSYNFKKQTTSEAIEEMKQLAAANKKKKELINTAGKVAGRVGTNKIMSSAASTVGKKTGSMIPTPTSKPVVELKQIITKIPNRKKGGSVGKIKRK